MEAIRFTSQGDYACSWCGYLIPTNSRNELRDYVSVDVAGMFCSSSHAIAAGNSLAYRDKYAHAKA